MGGLGDWGVLEEFLVLGEKLGEDFVLGLEFGDVFVEWSQWRFQILQHNLLRQSLPSMLDQQQQKITINFLPKFPNRHTLPPLLLPLSNINLKFPYSLIQNLTIKLQTLLLDLQFLYFGLVMLELGLFF